MPTTLKEWQSTQKLKAQAKRRGIAMELSYTSAPTAQWYRADGVPLPNLLPADLYHREQYEAKGWSLFPPTVKPDISWKPGVMATPSPQRADEEEPAITPAVIPLHPHRFTRVMGSPCKVQGCSAVRQREFAARK